MKKILLLLALFGPSVSAQNISGSGFPPVTCSSTYANQRYLDTTNGLNYTCVNISGTGYVWQLGQSPVLPVSSAPTGACTAGLPNQQVISTGVQYSCQNGTWEAFSGGNIIASVVIKTSGSPFIVPATSGFYWNNTASAYSFDLPAPVIGLQLCFGNYASRSSAVSVIPSTGVTIYYKGVAGTVSSPIGLVSSGASGDLVCLVATDATTYEVMGAGYGTWTNN
jgi:hypothetical protein